MDASTTERGESLSTTTASKTDSYFHVVDYVVFASMLALSAAIGVYFAIKSRNKTETKDYLLANREMTYGKDTFFWHHTRIIAFFMFI